VKDMDKGLIIMLMGIYMMGYGKMVIKVGLVL